MAAKETQEETLKDLVGVLADEAKERREARQVPISQVKFKTPWNPTGEPRSLKLGKWKSFSQNGALVNPEMLTTDEIEKIKKLRPGTYASKKITVLKRRDKSLNMVYKNKSFEDRMDLKNIGRSLSEILDQILTEQEAQDARRKSGEYVDDDE